MRPDTPASANPRAAAVLDAVSNVGAARSSSLAKPAAPAQPVPSSLESGAGAFATPAAPSTIASADPLAGFAPTIPGDVSARSASTQPQTAAAQAPSLRAVDAAGVVTQVVELTHEFRARDRSTVEVDFSFNDDTRLSVRLHLRDGEVHTTFRTDSEALRLALGREWQARADNTSRGERPALRLADPVFAAAVQHAAAPVAPSQASSQDFNSPRQSPEQTFSADARTAGGDARQHSPQAQADSSASHRGAASVARASTRSAGAAAPATELAETPARRSSDRLFQAFA